MIRAADTPKGLPDVERGREDTTIPTKQSATSPDVKRGGHRDTIQPECDVPLASMLYSVGSLAAAETEIFWTANHSAVTDPSLVVSIKPGQSKSHRVLSLLSALVVMAQHPISGLPGRGCKQSGGILEMFERFQVFPQSH